MPIVNVVDVTKYVEWQGSHLASTYNDLHTKLYDGNFVLSGMEVTSDGVNCTVSPGSVIHDGIVIELLQDVVVPNPALGWVLAATNVDPSDSTNYEITFYDPGLIPAGAVRIATFLSSQEIIPAIKGSLGSLSHTIVNRGIQPNYIDNSSFSIDPQGDFSTQVGPGTGDFALGTVISGIRSAQCTVTIGDSTNAGMLQSISEYAELEGRDITAAALVKTSVSGVALSIDISGSAIGAVSVSSVPHSGSGDWEYLYVSLSVPVDPDDMDVRISSTSDGVVYVADTVLSLGQFPGTLNFAPEAHVDAQSRSGGGFESGYYRASILGRDNGVNYIIGVRIRFRTPKLSAPSVSVSNLTVFEEGGTSDASGSYTINVGNVDEDGFDVDVSKPNGGGEVPRPNYIQFDWEAEV